MKRRILIIIIMLLMGVATRAQDSLVLRSGEETVQSLLDKCFVAGDDAERRDLSGKAV